MAAFDPSTFHGMPQSPWDQVKDRYPDKIVNGVRYTIFPEVKRHHWHSETNVSVLVLTNGRIVGVWETLTLDLVMSEALEGLTLLDIKKNLDEGKGTLSCFELEATWITEWDYENIHTFLQCALC